MAQSDLYKRSNTVDYAAGFPGSRLNEDLIVVRVDGGDLDISDRDDRELGDVEVADGEIDVVDREGRELGVIEVSELPEPVQTVLDDALASNREDAVMVQSDEALDVSAEIVTIEQDETLDVAQTETVTIQEESPVDVSASEVDIDIASQSLEQLASNISEIGGEAQSAVDVANAIDEIHGALESVGDTTVRVSSPSALDVSAETVTIQEDSPVETSVTGVPEVKKEENYGADIENDFEAQLDVGNYSLVDVSVKSDTNTKITIEKSWDENEWFTVVDQDDTDNLMETLRGAGGQYYRAIVQGTGTSGDTCDLVIAAKSR